MAEEIAYDDLYLDNFSKAIKFIKMEEDGNKIVAIAKHRPWFVYFVNKNRAKRLEADEEIIDNAIALIYNSAMYKYIPNPDFAVIKKYVKDATQVPKVAKEINAKAGLTNIRYICRVAYDADYDGLYLINNKKAYFRLFNYHTPAVFLKNEEMKKVMEEMIEKTKKLKVMAVDIEVLSEQGGFPKIGDPILSISYSIFNLGDDIFGKDWAYNNVKILEISRDSDYHMQSYELVNKFVEAIKKEKPNLIVTYNGSGFDFPYLSRYKGKELELTASHVRISYGNEEMIIPHIDLLSVRKSLGSAMGIRSQTAEALDDVALEVIKQIDKYYDISWIYDSDFMKAESIMNHSKLGEIWHNDKQFFTTYAVADVYLTSIIARVWLYSLFMLSVETGIPISILQELSTGQIAEYTMTEYLRRLGFYPEIREREADFYKVEKEEAKDINDIFKKGKVYVDSYGTFGDENSKIVEVDFAQLYPSDMVANTVDPIAITLADSGLADINTKIANKITNIILYNSKGKNKKDEEIINLKTLNGYGPISWLVYKLYNARNETKHLKKLANEQKRVELLAPDKTIKITNNCYTPDTYVITLNGIKKITEVEVGDKVLSVNPETLAIEIDTVTNKWEYDYDGILYSIEDKKTLDIIATPEQHMLVKKDGKVVFETIENIYNDGHYVIPIAKAHEPKNPVRYIRLIDYILNHKNEIPNGKILVYRKEQKYREGINLLSLPEDKAKKLADESENLLIKAHTNSKHLIPATLDIDKFMEIAGYYIAFGYYNERYYYINNKRLKTRQISIISRENTYKLLQLLKEAGIRYKVVEYNDIKEIKFNPFGVLESIIDNFGIAPSFKIPDWVIFETPISARRKFINALTTSSSIDDEKVYITDNKELRDKIIMLAIASGYQAKWQKISKKYRIIIYEPKEIALDKHKFNEIKYKGKVYDVTTAKNHTIFAGRNKKYIFTGQSFYGSFSKTRGNLVSETVSADIFWRTLTILYDVINFINNDLSKKLGRNLKVLYGDTDSAFILAPKDVSAEEIVKNINDYVHRKWGKFYSMDIENIYDYMIIPKQKDEDIASKKSYICIKDGKIAKVRGEFFKLEAPIAIKDNIEKLYADIVMKKADTKEKVEEIFRQYLENAPIYKLFVKKSVSSFVSDESPKKLKRINKDFLYASLFSLYMFRSPHVKEIKENSTATETLDKFIFNNSEKIERKTLEFDVREIEKVQKAIIVNYLPDALHDPKRFMIYVSDNGSEATVYNVKVLNIEIIKDKDIETSYRITFEFSKKILTRSILINTVISAMRKNTISAIVKKMLPAMMTKE